MASFVGHTLVAVALVVIGALDMYTTEKAMRRGARERNPVIRWLMERTGPFWAVIKLAVHCVLGFMVLLFVHPVFTTAAVIASLLTLYVCYRNMKAARTS